MYNETNIKLSKVAEQIVESIQDYKYRKWNNSGEYNRRYLVTFKHGTTYSSNSKADIVSYLRAHQDDILEEIKEDSETDVAAIGIESVIDTSTVSLSLATNVYFGESISDSERKEIAMLLSNLTTWGACIEVTSILAGNELTSLNNLYHLRVVDILSSSKVYKQKSFRYPREFYYVLKEMYVAFLDSEIKTLTQIERDAKLAKMLGM